MKTNELPYSILIEKLWLLKELQVVIDPCLAVLDTKDHFDENIPVMFSLEARNFSKNYETETDIIQHFNTLTDPNKFLAITLREIFTSTALYIAHEQTGNLFVNESIAKKAISRVEEFCNANGIHNLLYLYQMITTHTNLNALSYYEGIPKEEFLIGNWHRPFAEHFLSDDLKFGTLSGIMEVEERNGVQYVQITPFGTKTLQDITKMLEESGYFAQRISLLHISQFNTFDEYEKLAGELWPDSMQWRKQLIDFAGIMPGMKVLELGCGSGLLTFEAGLADRIGPEGQLICIDPSKKMINRAKAKPQASEKNWVTFNTGIAENLPFEDGSFDAVIGCLFLQLTDLEVALKEMRRVTRSGGIIASFHPLAYDLSKFAFFHEWFSPIFQLATKRKEQPKNCLFSLEKSLKSFEKSGLILIENHQSPEAMVFHDPYKVIKHFIHGIGFYQEELVDLPWKAREDIMDSLLERGISICQKYTDEERIIYLPCQFIKGIVP